MVGSSVFSLLSSRGHKEEVILKYCLILIALAMGVCCYTARFILPLYSSSSIASSS
jgi:hypothetical protein